MLLAGGAVAEAVGTVAVEVYGLVAHAVLAGLVESVAVETAVETTIRDGWEQRKLLDLPPVPQRDRLEETRISAAGPDFLVAAMAGCLEKQPPEKLQLKNQLFDLCLVLAKVLKQLVVWELV